ncbi:MAG: hypothetical protein ABSB60_06575 [Terracidiphilus sp.]|jgi:hypothetical protein
MTETPNTKLNEADSNAIVLRFSNPYDEGWTHGYVLDIGPQFFLFGLIDDNIKFNGFQCPLISDLRKVKVPDPHEDFIVAALRKRREIIVKKPDIDLSNLPTLLKSANALFPLVSILRERIKPDECVIGRVLDISEKSFLLHTIDPHAGWEEKPTRFRLSHITRVDFGGGYEEARHLVGGNPKPLKKLSRKKRP